MMLDTSSATKFQASVVMAYLDGMDEDDIIRENDDIYVPGQFISWARKPAVTRQILDETGWSRSEYCSRLAERMNRTKAREIVEYLERHEATLKDISGKYHRLSGGEVVSAHYKNPAVRALVMEQMGYTDAQLDEAWKRKSVMWRNELRRRAGLVIEADQYRKRRRAS